MASLRLNGNQIFQWLYNDSNVTDLLDTISDNPAIFHNEVIHEDYQDLTLIQICRLSTLGSSDLNPVTYTVNCRSSTGLKADEIAQVVYNSLNRKLANGKMAKCTVYKCIPEDSTHYNTPIDVMVYSNL